MLNAVRGRVDSESVLFDGQTDERVEKSRDCWLYIPIVVVPFFLRRLQPPQRMVTFTDTRSATTSSFTVPPQSPKYKVLHACYTIQPLCSTTKPFSSSFSRPRFSRPYMLCRIACCRRRWLLFSCCSLDLYGFLITCMEHSLDVLVPRVAQTSIVQEQVRP